MNENKDTDLKDSGEYEDDFEKDLEWLINEKEKQCQHCGGTYKLPAAHSY